MKLSIFPVRASGIVKAKGERQLYMNCVSLSTHSFVIVIHHTFSYLSQYGLSKFNHSFDYCTVLSENLAITLACL